MTTIKLKEKLIKKIQDTENKLLLEDIYSLFELDNEDFEIYKLNAQQIFAINESREEIKLGKVLNEDEANKEIDEWLRK